MGEMKEKLLKPDDHVIVQVIYPKTVSGTYKARRFKLELLWIKSANAIYSKAVVAFLLIFSLKKSEIVVLK